jgi:Ca-activated chloride channel family protein
MVGEKSVEITLKQLYGGQQKYALIEVEVPETQADQTRQIATATCQYVSAIDKKSLAASGSVEARFSAEREEVVRSSNTKVQEDLVINMAAETKLKSVERADVGDKDGASLILKEGADDISRIVIEYNVTNAQTIAPALEADSASVKDVGYSSWGRKRARTDSYQIYNQQKSER